MSKAILIMDMPENCEECTLFHNHYTDMCCGGLNNRTINYPYPKDFRQEWCPLKKLTDKEETTYENDKCDNGYMLGWNQCLEKILNR